MSKNKNTNTLTDQIPEIAQRAGMLLMTAAATVGMLDLPNHPNSKIVLPNQPALAIAGENTDENNPIRREREETAPHYVSYSVSQRTPGRSSKT